MKKNILVTGGGGYIGTELCNKLIHKYNVYALDTFWFGNKLNKKVKKIKCDTRLFNDTKILKRIHTVIHLAAIANDPSVELNPKLSWEVNVLGTMNMINLAVNYKVKKFIFASSGSVYGVKKEKKVTEKLSLKPISEYNKTKMIGERVVLSYKEKIKTVILRPATVCGWSKNNRFDVTVNILTKDAITKGTIQVFGGKQLRPNLHIKDMVSIYEFFLTKNFTGIFNAGFENYSINQIAKKITNKISNTAVLIKKSNDPRSYRIDSSKLTKLGFKSKFNIDSAIDELKKNIPKNFKVPKTNMRVDWLRKIEKNGKIL